MHWILKQTRVITGLATVALVMTAGLATPARAQQVTYTPVASGVPGVVDIAHAGDGRLFIVQQSGVIRILSGGSVLPTPFLNVSSLVSSGFEQGLLGLAFHPNYSSNGYFYINYTSQALGGDTVVARYSVSGNPDVADAGSAFTILTVNQTFGNHNGGDLNFGPSDGYLYIGMGDGGSGCDPFDDAQDGTTLLGKMLRIDVDGGSPYAIPPSNPFVGTPGVLDEIWATGLRNPWRFAFDRQAPHDMWIGDVGQIAREEIDYQPGTSSGGENYGWDCREGLVDSSASGCTTTATCPPVGGAVDPVHDYNRSGGRCSVTGGFVYRGVMHPGFDGEYFFADWCSNDLYSLKSDGGGGFNLTTYTTNVPGSPTTFGEDMNGEVYVGAGSTVYRLDDPTPPVSGCPASPDPTCDTPGKAALVIRDVPPPGTGPKDRMTYKSAKGPSQTQAAFGDPTSTTSYTFCLYENDAGSPALIAEAGVAAGAGWKVLGTKGFKFSDNTASQDGTNRIVVKGDAAQPRSRVVWRGKGNNLPMPSLPLDQGGPVQVRVHNSSNSNCWGADFPSPTTLKNDSKTFKAKLP